jgi:BlaI family transcriptional regulator, penicillinase repressor
MLQYLLQIDVSEEVHAVARFTSGEVEVMRILWEHGELSPVQIQEHYPRPIKNSALRAFLSVLMDKGHVARRRQGKSYFYRAKTLKDSAFRTMYRDLINIFCGGSQEALIFHIVKSQSLSQKELRELKQLAEEKIGKGEAKKP